MPAYRTLLFAVDRGVATITLNRPRQRNAIGDGMRDELADAYRACDRDDGFVVGVPDPRNDGSVVEPHHELGVHVDVTFETDFRSVYAQVIEQWLGADSRALLGGDFRKAGLSFI